MLHVIDILKLRYYVSFYNYNLLQVHKTIPKLINKFCTALTISFLFTLNLFLFYSYVILHSIKYIVTLRKSFTVLIKCIIL